MRPVGLIDLIHAARALMPVSPVLRAAVCDALISEAHMADRYRKKMRRAHPRLGPGTLSGAAQARRMAAEPHHGDRLFATCAALVYARLHRWRLRA